MIKSDRYLVVVLTVVVVLMMASCNNKHYIMNQGVVWTTEYHVKYEASADLNDSIQQLFKVIDESASAFNKQSRIATINDNKTDEADAFFVKLYTKAAEVNHASDGLYDPTVMPLVNAWGFGYNSGAMPTQAQLDSILQFVGMEHTSLRGNKIVKDDPRVQFDFSSIAKGMACDEVAAMLERNGVENYMVEIGGEVVARGVNHVGQPWHVSIDMPEPEGSDGAQHSSALLITLNGQAVATSGSYRKYKESNGKKLSHIVNPKTGTSETSSLLSVSIVAPSCMDADAWATACMAMGENNTKAMMESNDTLGVMTISVNADGDFVIWANKRFSELVVE